jgi:hypothetical protein
MGGIVKKLITPGYLRPIIENIPSANFSFSDFFTSGVAGGGASPLVRGVAGLT